MTTTTLAGAINDGLRHALTTDPAVLLLGEDIGRLGGVFRVTDGLCADFGTSRVVDTPLGEAGIVGTAVGLAMRGYRPVCEIQFDGFVYPAVNQIISQLAKYRHRSGGRIAMPVVIRIPYGGGIGSIEHHSESPEAYFAHTPGLKVVTCATPDDAFNMIGQAIASDDPVIFLEPKRRYWTKGEVSGAPALDLHRARTVRTGSDLTLVAYGPLVAPALETARIAGEEGHSVEVIDLRSLAPLDTDTVMASVLRTGRLVVTHEASRTHGIGAEIAARVQEEAFYALEAPVLRVTGYDTPYPPSRLEEDWLPGVDRMLAAVDRSLAH
ncbi:alpha-ketoacid dehydrogenase subunit beta [Streptomyces sp. BH-SS-21]|uniref:Alpha-ketoacid dehydrogenase subunit beta n=1 Tax=Streptomyces liliiviolaceus TaxID=2823109 RepID=A0A940Y2C9_9ACTN|nr:alpha-ketoacid dehydrogenase subunit beta [Streptomyces liliiviolaceus]MBQ0851100.1 alpha-ketoacid dehydrogenase subunit beta [Streptomyces liliiviolaceus]